MKPGLTLLAVILAVLLSKPTLAQLVKPIDVNKQADVMGKTVNFDNLQFDTLSQPMTAQPSHSPLSKGNLKFQDTDQKKAEFNTVDMSTITKPTLPKANFTTRSAEVDVPNDAVQKQADQNKKQSDQTGKKAQITQRQIHAFTPDGEGDLKHQLNEPPLEAH